MAKGRKAGGLFRGGLGDGFGGGEDLVADRSAHLLQQQVFFGKLLPRRDGAVGGFSDDRPQRACGQSCCIGKAPHLVGGDFTEAAAAAEGKGEFNARDVRQRGDQIVGGRSDRRAALGVGQRPVLAVHVGG